MSIDAYKAVWANSKQKGTLKLTLLALAEYASVEHDWTCWPTMATIAEMIGTSERQAIRNIQALEASGEIKVDRNAGRGNVNIYDLKPVIDVSICESIKGDIQCQKPDTDDRFSSEEKVTSEAEKVTSMTIKGDMDVTQSLNNPYKPLVNTTITADPIAELSRHFADKSGRFSNPASYEKDWKPILESWHHKFGDDAKMVIDAALEFALGDNEQGKVYVVASPRSLVNIVANMRYKPPKNGREPPRKVVILDADGNPLREVMTDA